MLWTILSSDDYVYTLSKNINSKINKILNDK